MTEEEFIKEFWGWCKGCREGDTAHTVETDEMRRLFRLAISEEKERCAKVAEEVSTFWSKNNGDYKEAALVVADEIRKSKEGGKR